MNKFRKIHKKRLLRQLKAQLSGYRAPIEPGMYGDPGLLVAAAGAGLGSEVGSSLTKGIPVQLSNVSTSTSKTYPSAQVTTPAAYQEAVGDITKGLSQAYQTLTDAYNTASSNFSPYIQQGDNALDALSDSLGIARPKAGSWAAAQAQLQFMNKITAKNAAAMGVPPPQTAGSIQDSYNQYVDNGDIQGNDRYIDGNPKNGFTPAYQQFLNKYTGLVPGSPQAQQVINQTKANVNPAPTIYQSTSDPAYQKALNAYTAQQTQEATYQGQLGKYNALTGMLAQAAPPKYVQNVNGQQVALSSAQIAQLQAAGQQPQVNPAYTKYLQGGLPNQLSDKQIQQVMALEPSFLAGQSWTQLNDPNNYIGQQETNSIMQQLFGNGTSTTPPQLAKYDNMTKPVDPLAGQTLLENPNDYLEPSTVTQMSDPVAAQNAWYNQLFQSPIYKAQLAQGQESTNAAYASQGLTGSGNNSAGMVQYIQSLQQSTANQAQQNLLALAQLGETASNQLATSSGTPLSQQLATQQTDTAKTLAQMVTAQNPVFVVGKTPTQVSTSLTAGIVPGTAGINGSGFGLSAVE